MYPFISTPYLILLSSIIAAAPSLLPLLPQNSTFSPLPFHTLLTKETQCRNPRFRYWYLSTPDCLQAINHLPPTNAPGTFHISGEDDHFRLPRGITYGNCHIEVDLLRGYAEETSNWNVVRQAATELVWACVRPNMHIMNKGGYTTTGPRDALFIKLQKPQTETGLPAANRRMGSLQ